MCGIAGAFQADPDNDREQIVRAMIGAIRHRGPGQFATWVGADGRIAFDHARLSIVDISPTGAQPMHSASERYTIAFNGEIYNHRELRQRLGSCQQAPCWRGTFDTVSDINTFETKLAA